MVLPDVPRLAWQPGPSLTLAHSNIPRGVHYDPVWGGAQPREELLHSVRGTYVLYLMVPPGWQESSASLMDTILLPCRKPSPYQSLLDGCLQPHGWSWLL